MEKASPKPQVSDDLEAATTATQPDKQVKPEKEKVEEKSYIKPFGFFGKVKLVVICLIVGGLDLGGFYSNWKFAVTVMAPLSNQDAIIAVNGTHTRSESGSASRQFNLPTEICNPSTEQQVPSPSWRGFLSILSILGVSVSSFLLLLGLIMTRYKQVNVLTLTWLLKILTLDPYGGTSPEQINQIDRFHQILLFLSQDIIFLITIGFYTFSCTPQGTFNGPVTFLSYLISAVNVVRRAFTLTRSVAKDYGWSGIIFMFFKILFTCPGVMMVLLLAMATTMVVLPLVRFFQVGQGAQLL